MEEHAKSSTIRDLTQGPLVRQLLLFALPIMGANLLQSLYTLVDLWAVGKFASGPWVRSRMTLEVDRSSIGNSLPYRGDFCHYDTGSWGKLQTMFCSTG